MLTYLSLGWGVQSWTLAAMLALEELPPIDAAISADTTWESEETYKFMQTWTPWLEERGVEVVTVSEPEQAEKATSQNCDMPVYTIDPDTGKRGQLRRQCTSRWKIDPIRRYISQELAKRNLKKTPGVVTQWLGITVDEIERAKDSNVKYIYNGYPLLDLGMTRVDCQLWLEARGLPIPPKSACVF